LNLKGLPMDLIGEFKKFTEKLAIKMFSRNCTEVKYDSKDE
jgi:hypothetical protein